MKIAWMAGVIAFACFCADGFAQQKPLDILRKALEEAQKPQGMNQPSAPQSPSSSRTAPSEPATGGALPQESKASVDVLGIKLGATRVAEAQAVLAKATPAPRLRSYEAVLVGKLTTGRAYGDNKEVPKTKYVSQLTAFRAMHEQDHSCERIEGLDSCEEIRVKFSAPPEQGIATEIYRQVSFVSGPLADNLMRSLIEKYGQPGYTNNYSATYRWLSWAWSVEGTPLALKQSHPCADRSTYVTDFAARQRVAVSALKLGCAATMTIQLQFRNNVVTGMTVEAIDLFGTYRTQAETMHFVDESMKAFEKGERDKAGAASGPKL